jgi:putative endonuclease
LPSTAQVANLPAGRQDLSADRQVGRRMESLSSFKFTVYAIKSNNRNYIYVGMSNNLERRLDEHNQRQNKSTKAYAPFTLLYSESFDSRSDARVKEKYLKSGVGKAFLKSLT